MEKDRAHDLAGSFGEAVDKATKSFFEKADDAAENFGMWNMDNGNLVIGVFVAVTLTLFVFGIWKAVNCRRNHKTEDKPKKNSE